MNKISLTNINNSANISSVKAPLKGNKEQTCQEKNYATNEVSFCGVKPFNISYSAPIKKIEKELKNFGINAKLIYDRSEKNFVMAQKLSTCIKQLSEKGYEIPKMKVHFDNCIDNFEGIKSTAAYMDSSSSKGKTSLEMFFNTVLYKNLNSAGDLFRIKKTPKESSFEADFFHEFAHASQANNNYENYRKLTRSQFDKDTSAEIAKNINTYATVTKAEFVAECFAFKMLGKDIPSPKVNKLFEECNGPTTLKHNTAA